MFGKKREKYSSYSQTLVRALLKYTVFQSIYDELCEERVVLFSAHQGGKGVKKKSESCSFKNCVTLDKVLSLSEPVSPALKWRWLLYPQQATRLKWYQVLGLGRG